MPCGCAWRARYIIAKPIDANNVEGRKATDPGAEPGPTAPTWWIFLLDARGAQRSLGVMVIDGPTPPVAMSMIPITGLRRRVNVLAFTHSLSLSL